MKDKKSNTRTPFHTIEKFYEIVHRKLKEQDEVYFGFEDGSKDRFAESFRNNPIVKKFYEFDSSSGKSVPKHYDTCFNNGCGIELADTTAGTTVGSLLESIDNEVAIELSKILPQTYLKKIIGQNISLVIGRIVMNVDEFGLKIEVAMELIIGLIDCRITPEECNEDLYDNEVNYIEIEMKKEETEDDSSQ